MTVQVKGSIQMEGSFEKSGTKEVNVSTLKKGVYFFFFNNEKEKDSKSKKFTIN